MIVVRLLKAGWNELKGKTYADEKGTRLSVEHNNKTEALSCTC